MARVSTFSCSECGVVKQQSNHWVVGLPGRVVDTDIYFRAWDDKIIYFEAAIHLCGEGCAAKVLSRQISAWRVQ